MTGQKEVCEIGIPVRAVRFGSLWRGTDDRGHPCLYAIMQQESARISMFMLQIDIETGASRRFDMPEKMGGGLVLWSEHWNRFFIYASKGMHGVGHLYQFNPSDAAVENLGRVDPDKQSQAISIDEAPDGTIYLGSFDDGCSLNSYRPDTGKFTHHGVMAEDEFYFYVQCGADGTVAGLVKMSKPHVVVLDTETDAHQSIGPAADTDRQEGRVELHKGGDGLLYIDSHEGLFRLQGKELTSVSDMPRAAEQQTLPDGSTFKFLDARKDNIWLTRYRTIGITRPDGTTKVIHLDYEAEGTAIYIIHAGTDGKIYGSSILPLHFFSYDPATKDLIHHGACTTASGEVYSMDCMDGKLYLCSYTHAILSEFDPSRPFNWGGVIPGKDGEFKMGGHIDNNLAYRYGEDDNPKQLGRMGQVSYRPRDMAAGPAGRVWVASIPDYGMWGGTLSSYDPSTGTFGTEHRHIIENCSPVSITHLKDLNLLAMGFSIYGGSGTIPRAEKAGFALWDPEKDQIVWKGNLGLDLVGVMDVEDGSDGLCYAITHNNPETVLKAELMLLDLPNEKVVSRIPISDLLGWPLEVSFRRDDNYLYGAAREGVYRIPLGTTDIEILWQDKEDGPGPSIGAAALCGGVYYFGSGSRLRSVAVL